MFYVGYIRSVNQRCKWVLSACLATKLNRRRGFAEMVFAPSRSPRQGDMAPKMQHVQRNSLLGENCFGHD